MEKIRPAIDHPALRLMTEIVSCGKRVRSSFVVFLLACSAMLSSLVGCASVTVMDNLPSNVPKGYVEFYYLKSEGNIGRRPGIFSIENDKKKFIGNTSAMDLDDKVGIRIARRPGVYDFVVELGTAAEFVRELKIEDGKVTPVRIKIGDISDSYEDGTSRINFTMKLTVEEAVPTAVYTAKK